MSRDRIHWGEAIFSSGYTISGTAQSFQAEVANIHVTSALGDAACRATRLAATGRRAIGWYAFAALLVIECDSRGTRIVDVFWLGELVRELVERNL